MKSKTKTSEENNVKPSSISKTKTLHKNEPIGIHNKLTDHHDKLLNLASDYSFKTLNIYNNGIYYMQKIWIKTPILKVFRPIYLPNDKCKNAIPLKLLLNDMVPETVYLANFIKRVELKVAKIIKVVTNNSKLKNKSAIENIESFPPIFSINMPFSKIDTEYEFNFHIYNGSNQRINMDNIKKATSVSLYLELTNVWVNNDNTFGYNWNVMQMKVYPEILFNKCLFDDIDLDVPAINIKNSECYHCLYCPNNHIRTLYSFPTTQCNHNIVTSPIPPPLPPSMPKQQTIVKNNIIEKPIKDNNKKEISYVPTINDILSVKLKPLKTLPPIIENESDKNDLLSIKNNLK